MNTETMEIIKLTDELSKYTNKQLVDSIDRVGVECLCGVSYIKEHEVWDFIKMMELCELADVLNFTTN